MSLPQGHVRVVVVPGHFPPAAPIPLLAGALTDSHLPVAPWCSQHAGAVSGVRDTCCSSSLGPQHCSQCLVCTQGLCRDCTGCNEHQFKNLLTVPFFFLIFPTGSSRSKGEYLKSLFLTNIFYLNRTVASSKYNAVGWVTVHTGNMMRTWGFGITESSGTKG